MLLFVLVQLLSGPAFAQCCSLPISWVLCLFVLQFASSSSFSEPIVLQHIVSMFSNLISGIPNNAYPFPGTTKKLHILHFLLHFNFTLHMHNYVIVVWLYIFSLIVVSFLMLTTSLLP